MSRKLCNLEPIVEITTTYMVKREDPHVSTRDIVTTVVRHAQPARSTTRPQPARPVRSEMHCSEDAHHPISSM